MTKLNVFLRSVVIAIIFSFTSSDALSYEFSFVIKERREVIFTEIHEIIQNYGFVIDERNLLSNRILKTLPVVVEDVACQLEVYLTFHNLNTYRLLLVFSFYKVTEEGFVTTNTANEEIWGLISALKYEIKRKFWREILYEYN